MNQLDWGQIKGNFRGFEELAFEFVKDVYPNAQKWIKTPQTRDGNKDAYTIVFGFSPYPAKEEQWWMEAKYSTTYASLTRYRLDATIVSALLSGNISKVIFVTNIAISTKTIIDIRNALKISANCKEVHFCTKHTLEYWLSQKPTIAKKFFPKLVPLNFEFPEILLTEEMEFFSEISSHISFREPLHILKRGQRYCAFFSLFSVKKCYLHIRPLTKGVTIISNQEINLSEGENALQFLFELNSEHPLGNSKRGDVSPVFKIGTIDLIPKYVTEVSGTIDACIDFSSQKQILNDLNQKVKKFLDASNTTICCIRGQSGTGKSYTLEKASHAIAMEKEDLFHACFYESPADNNKLLIDAVLFVLFPYINPEDIDTNYIQKISHKNYISHFMKEIIKHKDSYDDICNLFSSISSNDILFPMKMSIKRRFILLDNLQKLNFAQTHFLFSIVFNAWRGELPLFFILSAQPSFFEEHFEKFKNNITFQIWDCALDEGDFFQYLEKHNVMTIKHIQGSIRTIFPNLVELFWFVRHLGDLNQEIKSLDDFVLACKAFHSSQLSERYILNQFNDIFTKNQKLKEICDAIYWSENGVLLSYQDLNDMRYATQLIEQNLVQYNDMGMLIPYHEIYQNYYRRHFQRPQKLSHIACNATQELQNQLYFDTTRESLQKMTSSIIALIEAHKFHTVHYILEDMFVFRDKSAVKGRVGDEIFYQLYMCFAMASTNVSMTHSGRKLFKMIMDETIHHHNPNILLICESATWELVNSLYEWLEFENAKAQINTLFNVIRRLQQYNLRPSNIKKCIRFHDATVIQTLIESDLNMQDIGRVYELRGREMLEYGFEYRYYTFLVRYANTLLLRDINNASRIMHKCSQILLRIKGDSERYYLWSSFTYHYIQMILHNDFNELLKVLEIHNKLRQHFFNDYRKKYLAIASFYYCNGEFELGNRYLLMEGQIERDLRPRQKAFYYETIALHEFLSGRDLSAIDALEKAAEIFKELPEYYMIISHNIKMITQGVSNRVAQFCCNNQLETGIYYIDPRCVW